MGMSAIQKTALKIGLLWTPRLMPLSVGGPLPISLLLRPTKLEIVHPFVGVPKDLAAVRVYVRL